MAVVQASLFVRVFDVAIHPDDQYFLIDGGDECASVAGMP